MSMIDPAVTNFYLDTEFREKADGSFAVDFFSIGLVDQNGRDFYGVSDRIKDDDHKDHWVYENVIVKLPPQPQRQSLSQIREGLTSVFKGANERAHVWARNGSYDFFVLCRIYGGMLPMREALKKECGISKIEFRDAKELLRLKPLSVQLPTQDPATEHISIADARQERAAFFALCGIQAPALV